VILERVVGSPESSGIVRLGSFIDGRLVDGPGEGEFDVFNPATGEVLARLQEAGTTGVQSAVDAGLRAFPSWRRTPARDRAAVINALADRIESRADELARLDAIDTGNPITAMRGDLAKGVRLLREAAGLALEVTGLTYPLPGLHFTRREPWGVVGRLVTFNHPAMFTCARLGAALVAGNCVVIKPSELAPLSALAIGELTAALVPDGVVSVVAGGPATGAAIVSHPDIRRISFTGSTSTALRIQGAAAASDHIKTLTFELGGKNPILVFPDVDIDEASQAIVRGMNFTRVQGQSCGSTSRLIIHRSIAEPVLERVSELVARIRIGPPLDPTTEMGSMISPRAKERCLDVVGRGVTAGATVMTGGGTPSGEQLRLGSFVEPTVMDGVTPDSELAREEIFGPVLVALRFDDEGEALALANEGDYGLTAAVWTNDVDRAFRVSDAVDAGYVWINDVETRYPAVPFGGWKDSGVGAEHGLEEILSMTRLKAFNLRIR
jgi:acyl-CoA reductase-like NAD-dependent aldehyde dehydrogenase